MARPLRIEFPGALYHITSRGDRREPIFEDDGDRKLFLDTLGDVVTRFHWLCHAYCLMANHYHLIVETPDGNLSRGMRQLNGVYTQATNRRHRRSGHLFQGRFKSILVDRDNYLLELSRYVVLNPVRAGLVDHPRAWAWSSYCAMVGQAPAPGWLTTDVLLSQFDERRTHARHRYRQFVSDGIDRQHTVWSGLRQQIYLGDEAFVERVQKRADVQGDELSVPQVQRRAPAPSLQQISASHPARNEAIVAAYATGAYSYREIAEYHGLHLATIGRIVRKYMQQCEN